MQLFGARAYIYVYMLDDFSIAVYKALYRNTSTFVGMVSGGMARRPQSSSGLSVLQPEAVYDCLSRQPVNCCGGVKGHWSAGRCYIFHGTLKASSYSHWKVACIVFYKVWPTVLAVKEVSKKCIGAIPDVLISIKLTMQPVKEEVILIIVQI